MCRATRPLILGPDSPEPPFPIALAGNVQTGFGRGGKELGCPTGKRFPGRHSSLSLLSYP